MLKAQSAIGFGYRCNTKVVMNCDMDLKELEDESAIQATRTTLADGRYLIYYTFSIELEMPTGADSG